MFKADFNFSDLENDIRESLDFQIRSVADALFEAGKKAVDRARLQTRSEGGFGNITWNLRGSIGCVLLIDHELPSEYIYFPPVSNGEEGRKIGEDYAREIALLVADGEPTLILVAGMDYAGYVEARDGYDVITGSSLQIDKLFKSLL